jgi:hypothetical protein
MFFHILRLIALIRLSKDTIYDSLNYEITSILLPEIALGFRYYSCVPFRSSYPLSLKI